MAMCTQPDWDMFHSKHPAAEAHAAARAVSGAAVYVSDYPGQHDFDLLKRLVLPGGGVLRASLPGRPTADCIFTDVLRDGKSVLKVRGLEAEFGLLWMTLMTLSGMLCMDLLVPRRHHTAAIKNTKGLAPPTPIEDALYQIRHLDSDLQQCLGCSNDMTWLCFSLMLQPESGCQWVPLAAVV